MARVLLVDGTAYLYRCHFAMPERAAVDGTPVGAVVGLARLLLGLLRQVRPRHVCIAFDLPGRTFRHELYSPYKADRNAPPEALMPQFALAPRLCHALGLAVAAAPSFEADDILATLAGRAERAGWDVVVVTADKDLAQLVTDRVRLWECVRNEHTGPEDVQRRMEVAPNQVADLLALAGDSTDHFPGVRGIGRRTAARLLQHAGSLEALLRDPELAHHAGVHQPKAVARRLAEGAADARLFRRISTVRRDVPCQVGSSEMLWTGARRADTERLFQHLGIPGMLSAVPLWSEPAPAADTASTTRTPPPLRSLT